MNKLKGKVAVVTRVSKGIGAAIAKSLAAEDQARVIANIRVVRIGTKSGNRRNQSRNSQAIGSPGRVPPHQFQREVRSGFRLHQFENI